MIPLLVMWLILFAPVIALVGFMVYIFYQMGAFVRSENRPFVPNDDSWYLVPSSQMDEWLGRRWRAFWEELS
jgi:hypothetical protein